MAFPNKGKAAPFGGHQAPAFGGKAPAKGKVPPHGGKIPNNGKNDAEIIAAIENKLGPVGAGHHNSHRTANLAAWLKAKRGSSGGSPVNQARAQAFAKRSKGGK
jgi:hypothetical protein